MKLAFMHFDEDWSMKRFMHRIITCATEVTLLYEFCIYSRYSKVFHSDLTKAKASCLRDVSYDFVKTICEGWSFMRRERFNMTWVKVITEVWGYIETGLSEVRVECFCFVDDKCFACYQMIMIMMMTVIFVIFPLLFYGISCSTLMLVCLHFFSLTTPTYLIFEHVTLCI